MSTQIHPTQKEVRSIRQAELPIEVPPIPPRNDLVTRIQRMQPGGRWALGLALAFLSAAVLWSLSGMFMFSHSVAFLGALALALAAGVVLPSWRAWLPLLGAMLAGGVVGSIALAVFLPSGEIEGQTGIVAVLIALAFFALVDLAPLTLLAFAGIGLGKTLGATTGQQRIPSTREATRSRWIAALFPVIAAGLVAPQISNLPGTLGMQDSAATVTDLLPGIAYAIALSLTCALAGWLLRSWLGLLVTALAYIAAIALILTGTSGGGPLPFASYGGVLYIVLPAVVMSAIGTFIGMWRAHWAPRPA